MRWNGLRTLTLSPVCNIQLGDMAFHDLSAEVSDNVLEHDVTVGLDVLRRLHTYWDVPAGRWTVANAPRWASARCGGLVLSR